jgi:hypothetical protein
MKIVQSLAISAFVLLSIQTVSAQYGNNGYGGGAYDGSGRMNSGMNQDRSQDKPREIPAEETISKIMLKLKPAVGLDELQEIAIANILLESIKRQGVILKQETNQSDQMKDIQILSENTERRIVELLNEDQKEKYKIFSEESRNPKKSRKK